MRNRTSVNYVNVLSVSEPVQRSQNDPLPVVPNAIRAVILNQLSMNYFLAAVVCSMMNDI